MDMFLELEITTKGNWAIFHLIIITILKSLLLIIKSLLLISLLDFNILFYYQVKLLLKISYGKIGNGYCFGTGKTNYSQILRDEDDNLDTKAKQCNILT